VLARQVFPHIIDYNRISFGPIKQLLGGVWMIFAERDTTPLARCWSLPAGEVSVTRRGTRCSQHLGSYRFLGGLGWGLSPTLAKSIIYTVYTLCTVFIYAVLACPFGGGVVFTKQHQQEAEHQLLLLQQHNVVVVHVYSLII